MEREVAGKAEILKKLIEISALQLDFLRENRIEKLFELHSRREGLIKALGSPGADQSPELSTLARELAASDAVLATGVRELMDSIASRLGQVKTGMSAVKAYARY